jgi:hypothetical protein
MYQKSTYSNNAIDCKITSTIPTDENKLNDKATLHKIIKNRMHFFTNKRSITKENMSNTLK